MISVRITRNHRETRRNLLQTIYIRMKNDLEAINKSQEEMKNTISEVKNKIEGIKSRLDGAED